MMKRTTSPACDQKRRSFIKLCGLVGLGTAGVAASVLPLDRAETLLFGKGEYKVSKTRLAMGSFLAITAFHPSRDLAEEALGLAFQEVDRLSRLLSRHDATTPVAHLNRTGSLSSAPPELLEVMHASLAYHRLTKGAFDITVQPLVDLFKERFAAGRKPSEAEISALLPRVGSEKIHLAERAIHFQGEGMGVTLDGIAPGYIVDRVSALLTKLGVSNHLINCSGDIRTSGAAAKGEPWTVAIQDPKHQQAYPDVLRMGSGAISTSGSYEIYYDQERTFHHIVTPRTGHSPLLATSVTTTAPTVMAADALATGLMVMPPEEGVRLVANQLRCQCFIIGRDQRTMHTPGWSAAAA